MTVNCNIYIPVGVGFEDIIEVVSILSGNKPELKKFDSDDGVYITVENTDAFHLHNNYSKTHVSMCSTTCLGMFMLNVPENNIDNEYHFASFHFNVTGGESGYYLLSGGSNDYWKTIGKGLVEFFGGFVDFNDCDDIEKDFEAISPRKNNSPTDGEDWNNFQLEKFNLWKE